RRNREKCPPQTAYFLPEFALSPQGSFLEDTTGEKVLTYRYDDQTSRSTRSDEDKAFGWDAWGPWSDCSRTCGGGASYSLRRCLNIRHCEGRNIRYKTCSNVDCPPEAGDFRDQQCSAHNDMKHQGQSYEWIPVYSDPDNPCALKCQAWGTSLIVELSPKVLDGTRCNPDTLNMCISGICQVVGCDRQLGSKTKEDNCGICAGDGSTCRLVRGQAKSHVSPEKLEDTVIAVPYGSRHVKITVKGPAHLYIESKTLQGRKEEHNLNTVGSYDIENTTVEFQKSSDKEILKIQGPLGADFIIKTRNIATKDSVVQFIFYQPISHQWRETDFYPCTVTCGGGYQLSSAECIDVRSGRVVPEHYCKYYPENKKPKPKLQECNMDHCPSSDGFKQLAIYDHFQPLPRWETNPWTACSMSCGGGVQKRSVSCIEENVYGEINQVEEWKCMYALKPLLVETCNLFECPKWRAMEWSPCTVTCGRGLRYRVVLCIDHRGQHTGGCNPLLKPYIKEECTVPIPCHKTKEKLPVEAKIPWIKQAQELLEPRAESEEPTFIPEAWTQCSTSCGVGKQVRVVKCLVFLSFSQTEEELPDEECEGPKPAGERVCNLGPCDGVTVFYESEGVHYGDNNEMEEQLDWEYEGFTPCSASCAGGKQETIVVCLNMQTHEIMDDRSCDSFKRPPHMVRTCNVEPCPPRWNTRSWKQCTATCGVGIQTRDVFCLRIVAHDAEDTTIIPDEECLGPKPSELQACNQFDCPPSWHKEKWQPCSQTCGGGLQSRKVQCKQLVTDGSFLSLPEEFCLDPKPLPQKPCVNIDCAPHLALGGWSECSVSCGEGIQRREWICHRLAANEPFLSILFTFYLCIFLEVRKNPKAKASHKQSTRDPQIIGLHRVYIQTRQEKRIHFSIGGRAYLLPKTSVVIKCPVRRFQKSLIRWAKDGQDLQNTKRIGITKSGSLKIHHLKDEDIGIYSCIAGSVSDTFVLKLIGNDNKLIESPASAKTKTGQSLGPEKTGHNGSNRLEEKWTQLGKMWHNWSEKNEFYLDNNQASDRVFLRLLGNHLVSKGKTNSADSYDSRELYDKQLKAAIFRGAYSMDASQFEELLRNVSLWIESGELAEDYASLLMYQLAAEASRPEPTVEKWKMPLEENASNAKFLDKTPNASETFSNKDVNRQTEKQNPTILRKNLTHVFLEKNINVTIGTLAFLTSHMDRVTLLCQAAGSPEQQFSWTKDGLPVTLGKRLQIQNFSRQDAGLYACTVSSELGTDTETSLLLYSEIPVIRFSRANITNLTTWHLSAVVGSAIIARLRATITIECPAEGIPKPKITWQKKGGFLGNNSAVLQNGSLVLINVTLANRGIYSCSAANEVGQAIASTFLKFANFTWAPGEWTSCTATCGNTGIQYRKLRCLNNHGIEVNESTCHELPKLPLIIQLCNARDCPARWVVTALSECSVTCGKGIHQEQVTCEQITANGTLRVLPPEKCAKEAKLSFNTDVFVQKLNGLLFVLQCTGRCVGQNFAVQHRQIECHVSICRPVSTRQCKLDRCNVQWRTGPWRQCTATCGNGFQSRWVACTNKRNNKAVTDQDCGWQRRPITWQRCNVTSCDWDCKDTTRYCALVKRLRLCQLKTYRQRCCDSCRMV
uniref:ADAMTS like 3 n=1 Tax=Callorhinchus milii TaxID=7868 RepID=A0A4W3GVM2_CALMI